jgi:probable O-glycosylation ligase (exosortase A-associated)
MRDLYIAGIYMAFVVMGFTCPFVFTLGYMWVDTFYPQIISDVVGQIPAAMIMAICAVSAYLIADRKSPPRFSAHTALTLCFAVWMSLTLWWAEVPEQAWAKWDWAFKTVIVSMFVTLSIRSRVQIESFLQVFLFSALVNFMPLGVKMLLSGSSYGMQRGIIAANSGFSESSSASAVCIALIPLVLYLRRHSILLPKSRLRDIGYYLLVAILVLAAVSTFARTAVVGFVVLAGYYWMTSRRKVVFTTLLVVGLVCAAPFLAGSWEDRISTVTDYAQENSALGRILAWKWTLGYVAEHPFGGSFYVFMINHIEFPAENGEPPVIRYGIAFHNMYFEVLGETGYPGLLLYVSLLLTALWYLFSVMRQSRQHPHLAWCRDLASALLASTLIIMACGMFIGVAFQATVWYLIALPVCVREYVNRVMLLDRQAAVQPGLPALRGTRALVAMARGAR